MIQSYKLRQLLRRTDANSHARRNHQRYTITPRGAFSRIAVAVLSGFVCVAANVSITGAADVAPISLIPDTAAGTVRVPDMPAFCAAWKTTTLHSLAQDDAMKPFVDAQRLRAEKELFDAGLKVGLKLRDLLEIASGEAVVAWLPFKDPKRPYSIAVVADVRGLNKKAEEAIEQVDKDLIAGGAKRKDVKYGDDVIRVYAMKSKPGELKLDEVAITLNQDRIISSDRESVVTAMLDRVAGKSPDNRLIAEADYVRVETQIKDRADAANANKGVIGFHWFARPLAMGRIVKDAVGIDRGRQVDVLALLERQGFNAVRAAGGSVTIGHDTYDLLHHGFVFAPPVTDQPSKYKLAARTLQFPNLPTQAIPDWVGEQSATYTRLNWRMDEAFWAAETLVNDAFGDEIFRDIFDGIRDDEGGPRIDVAKNVIPNLGTHLILLTDNKLPPSESSERLLVAVEVKNAAALKDAVKRAMEVEPDASLVEGVPGAEIYRVRHSDEPADFDAELFDDLGLNEEPDPDAPPPLLNQLAITVIGEQGKSGGYLLVSSHPEMIVEIANRMGTAAKDGLGSTPEFKTMAENLAALGGESFAMERMVRTDQSLRVKYELLREGKLRESDSLLTSLFRRIFENANAGGNDKLDAKKLPPISEIEKYFRPAGTHVLTTDDGWQLDGFLMK